MAEAKLYKAQEDFKFRGVHRKAGDIFRITDEKAAKLGDKVKLADESPSNALPEEKKPSDISTSSAPEGVLPTKKMAQYTVKEAFELEGVNQEVGTVVELSEEKALELGEKVEAVAAEVPPAGENTGEAAAE